MGGNFGGGVGSDAIFPRQHLSIMCVCIRLRHGSASFSTSFRDTFSGWQQITIPFSAFQGQPGSQLDLSAITQMSFSIPGGMRNPVMLDQIRLACADSVTVSSTADSGAGSLRKALGSVCINGTISFAPALAGQTIILTSGPILLNRNVSIDASAAAGLTLSGNNADRVLIVNAGTTAQVSGLTIAKWTWLPACGWRAE